MQTRCIIFALCWELRKCKIKKGKMCS